MAIKRVTFPDNTTQDINDPRVVSDAIMYIGDTQGSATYVDGGSTIDVSTKADKVANAVNGNFAALDSNGNLTDSGHKHSDYLTSESDPVFVASAAYGISSSDINNWNSKTDNVGTLTGVKFNNVDAAVSGGIASIITTETDPIFAASAAAGITSSDITNWNGKTSNTGTVTGVKMNGTTNNPTYGVVDLGTVITSETSLSKGSTSGNGNAVTDISVSGHQITLTKGSTFLTSETSLSKGTTSGSGNAVTDISVSGHQITLTKGSTFLTSETSLSKGSDSGSGNVVTDISVSGHQITLTKGSTVPVPTAGNAGKIPVINSGGTGWDYVTPSAIYSGGSTPSNSVGNNGDIYLQM